MIPYTPHPYQERAIGLLCERSAGLFLDPGMGKTSIALAAFMVLKSMSVVRAALVIAPKRPMLITWPAEVAKWADFSLLQVSIVTGTACQRRKALERAADLYVINPENIDWLVDQIENHKLSLAPDMLIVDESTRFKNPGSVRFKALKRVLFYFKRRYILTGTPAPQSIADLFAQSYLLDDGKRLGRFVTGFRKRYMTEHVEWGGYSTWASKAGAESAIFRELDNCMRLSATDYLTMPARMDNRIEVELPANARAAYRELARHLVAQIGAGAVSAANAAAATMKLRQLANGTVYSDEGTTRVHDEKLNALEDLVEEQSGQPLLVAVAFLHEVTAIRDRLGHHVPYLGGGVSDRDSAHIVVEWNAGKIPVLLAHPTSVAHGLNLQAGGNAVCWYGLTWNLEEYIQFNARVWRQGQEKTVVVHHIVARDTVDDVILAKLGEKDATQARLFEALKEQLENA